MKRNPRLFRLGPDGRLSVVAAVLGLACLSCAAERSSTAQPEAVASLAPGQASGAVVVDGDALPLRHAYAQREKRGDGSVALAVLLSDKPVPTDLIDGENRLREVLIASGLDGLSFRIGAGEQAEDWKVVHPRLDTGCALCSDWRAELSRSTATAVAGSVSTATPTLTQSRRLEFRATFAAVASLAKEISDPGGTPAQREARARIREAGMKFTPSDFLASRTDPAAVALFLEGGMPADTPLPGTGETLLLETLASSAELPEVKQVARLLIDAGANVNQIGVEGSRPLLRAGCCADVLEMLLDAGARLDLVSPIPGETIGQTVMGEAITFERPEVVRLLIRRGYDVAGDSRRLLDKAQGRPDIEKILHQAMSPRQKVSPKAVSGRAVGRPTAQRHPDPEQARRELGRRGIPVAADELWSAIMDPDEEKVDLLLEAGLDPNLRRESVGDTPLLFAATMAPARGEPAREKTLTGIIFALIAHGADVNAADTTTAATPLLQAAQYCPPEVVRALIKAGARLKTAARGGATPLMMAVIFGRTETVRILLDAGYDVAAERDGLAPLAAGKPDIEKLLKPGPVRTGR